MNERSTTTRLSDEGLRLIIVERWLDRQVLPPRWRSKNRHRKLSPAGVEYYRQRGKRLTSATAAAGGPRSARRAGSGQRALDRRRGSRRDPRAP
jgi:hypothetical protein